MGDRNRFIQEQGDVLANASKHAGDAKQPSDHRLLCLHMLSYAPWATAKQLLPLAEKEPNSELRIAALRALAAQQDKEVPALLMKLWPSAPPSVRREILEAMLRQPGRVNVLLDEIESKRMKAGELDPARTRQLINHKDAAIRERAKKLLADNRSGRSAEGAGGLSGRLDAESRCQEWPRDFQEELRHLPSRRRHRRGRRPRYRRHAHQDARRPSSTTSSCPTPPSTPTMSTTSSPRRMAES